MAKNQFFMANHLHHLRHCDFYYLLFRRLVIFADEWLSYALLLAIYYYWGERDPAVLGPIIALTVCFNLTGYYYLHLLEMRFQLYDPPPCDHRGMESPVGSGRCSVRSQRSSPEETRLCSAEARWVAPLMPNISPIPPLRESLRLSPRPCA